MANQAANSTSSVAGWQAKQVYVMAGACLLVGLAIGYLFRGSSPTAPAQAMDATGSASTRPMPSLEEMKRAADKRLEPLLAKLKTDPNNAGLLIQIGDVYKQTHQFREAAQYYQKSLQADPGNAGVRSDLASVLYYSGDVDGALAQLEDALKRDPQNAPALFNLGMIKFEAKHDGPGAVAAWETLLKANPQLGADRTAAVQKLIAKAKGSR